MSIGIGSLRISLARLITGVVKIAGLFVAGLQGVWEDLTSTAYLFQDSGGTTPVTAMEQQVGRVTDRSGNGNHVIQATAAARPAVSSRINQILNSDGAFTPTGGGPTIGTYTNDTDLLGGQTAKRVVIASTREYFDAQGGLPANTPTTVSFYIRIASGTRAMSITLNDSVSDTVRGTTNFTATTSFQRITVSGTPTTIGCRIELLGFGVGDVYWGYQIESGLITTRYQRINTATDYDTAGFSNYLKWDGIQTSMGCATGGGSTVGFTWARAIRPTGGAGTVRTLWSDATANGGYKVRINASNQLMFSAGNGTPLAPPVQNAAVNSATGGTGLAASTAYFYVVTALNAQGESLKSNEITVTTTAGTTDSNTISWTASSGATSYRVYRGTATGAENVFYTTGNVTSFVDTGAASTAGSPPLVTETAFTTATSGATLAVGTLYLLKARDDGTVLNVQVGTNAGISVLRPVVVAGTASFTEGKDNGLASGFFTGSMYTSVYRTGQAVTTAELASIGAYVSQQAGL